MHSTIDVQTLNQLIQTGLPSTSILVDVRMPFEFNAGHVLGSVNMPLSKLSERMNELSAYEKIYLICQSGGRSSMACELLSNKNMQIYNVNGGMLDWLSQGLPVAKS